MKLTWPAAATVAAMTLLFAGTADAATVPPSGELDFTVLRDGKEIGSHVMRFTEDGSGGLDVDIETDIEVSVMFVTVYRFEHEGHERWQDGQLFSLTSKTDDDGEPHDLVVMAEADGLKVSDNGVDAVRPAGLLPASLWNDAIVAQPSEILLNTLDGSAMNVTVTQVGDDTVQGLDGKVSARHYVLTGDLARELWYDTNGVLVKVRFAADDGSDIQYVLN